MVESKTGDKSSKKAAPAKKGKKAARKPRGRPEFEPTAEQRERVEILVGGGMAIEEIAAALDLAKNTLKKHFGAELTRGRSRKRAEALEAMFNSAKGGNVSAQKAYIALNTVAAADAAWMEPTAADATAPTAKSPKLGKKEQALEDASTAGLGTEWKGDLETPPLPGAKPN